MPQDINSKVNPIGGETGKPGGASGAPSKSDLTSINKWIDSLKENLYISDKFEKVREKIRKHFVDETKLTDKYVKGIIKENTNIKVQTKLLKENLETSKKVLQLNAKKAKKQLFGQNFDTLVSARSVIKQIGHSIKEDIEGELEEVDELLGKNRLGWIAVGAATIYASKKTYEYVESVADAAVNFATYRKNLQSVANSTLIAPKGVDQLEEVRENLGQTTKQFSEFVDIARSSAFPNAAEDLQKVSEALKTQFGEDQNQRLRQYVDLLNEIPSIDTDLSITATLDDKANAVVNLVEAGKLDVALDLQSAGLLGGTAAPQTDQQKRDSALLNATEEMEAGVENIKQSILQYLPADAIKFATIVGQVTLLAGTAYGALTTLGTIATLLKRPESSEAAKLAVQEQRKTNAELNQVTTGLKEVKAAVQGAKFLQKGGAGDGAAEVAGNLAVKGGGGKAALASLAVVAATTLVTAVIAKATSAVEPAAAGAGGAEAGNLAVQEESGSIIKEVAESTASIAAEEAARRAIGSVIEHKGISGLTAAAKGGAATLGEGAGAAKGFLSGASGAAKFAKGGIFAALTIAAEYAGTKLTDFGKNTVDSAKESKESFDVETSAADRLAASNNILKGSAAKAGGAVLKFGGSVAGLAATGATIGSVVPLIGTAVGGVVGALAGVGLGAKDFLSDFGSGIKEFNDELKPGFLKTALNLAIVGPLSLVGVDLSTIGGAMASAGEAIDDFFSSTDQKKQKEIDKQRLVFQKKLIAEDKKYLAEVRKGEDVFRKSAIAYELYRKQIGNAVNEASVATFKLGAELANLQEEIATNVTGSTEDFVKALSGATDAVTGKFNKFNTNLDDVRGRILNDNTLTAELRKKGLDLLHIQELNTLKNFTQEVERIATEFAKIPSIVLNNIKSELAEKQKEVASRRGGGEKDRATAVAAATENEARALDNFIESAKRLPDALSGIDKGIKAIEQNDKDVNKQGVAFLKKNAEDIKNLPEIKTDDIGDLTNESKEALKGFQSALNSEVEGAVKNLKNSGALSNSFSKVLEDKIKESEAKASAATKKVGDSSTEKGLIIAEAKAKIAASKEEADKAAISADLTKKIAKIDAEAATYQDAANIEEQKQYDLSLERIKQYADVLKSDKALSKTVDEIVAGNPAQDAQALQILQKRAAAAAEKDNNALGKELGDKQQVLQAVNQSLRVTETTALRTKSEASVRGSVLDNELKALEASDKTLESLDKIVDNSKDRQLAEAEQAKSLTDIEKFGKGGKPETSLKAVGEGIAAIQKKTGIAVKGYEANIKVLEKGKGDLDALLKKAEDSGDTGLADTIRSKIADKEIDIQKEGLKIDEAQNKSAEDTLSLVEKQADLQKSIISSQLSTAENVASTLSEIGATPGAILGAQKQVIALEKQRLDITQSEVDSLRKARDTETDPEIKAQRTVDLNKKINEFESQRLDLVKKTIGIQRDGYEKLVAIQLGQLRAQVGARSGIGSNAAIFGRNRVQLQSGLQVKGGSSTIAQRQAQIAGAASGLSNGQPVSQFGDTLGNNPSRSPNVRALQFNKAGITPGAQTPASGTVPASQVPATGASTVPTPGGPAATKGEANKVGVNIKTNVEVTFDTDMFKSKVRQFVLKDPDIQGGLAKIFVQVR